jgi:predicted metal-dependent hydrolase
MQTSQPKARNIKFPFESGIPKDWLNKNLLQSHAGNGLTLIFPEGERFFIRSVRAYADQIQDPVLKKKVASFIAQEVQHGREHERVFDTLRDQGFNLETFLDPYRNYMYQKIEPLLPKALRLADTAALEHYTAAFAEYAIKSGILKNGAYPVMADLFHWHAAEEIEHKSVAYDVMMNAGISYPTRALGMLIATPLLFSSWIGATLTLLRQDPEIKVSNLFQMLFSSRRHLVEVIFHLSYAFFEYLIPGFHPSQRDNEALALSILTHLEKQYLSSSSKRPSA